MRYAMWSRTLCALSIAAVAAVTAAEAQTGGAPAPCSCCAKKPRFDDPLYSTFTGQVVVATQTENSPSGNPFQDQVVMIWDLTNQAGAPLNQFWDATHPVGFPPTHPYSNAAWTWRKLGDVFGLALDGGGNIYVAATSIMGGHNLGSVSTGAGNARAGQIYKLQNGSGTPVPFGLPLPQGSMGEGLGNIAWDCGFNSLYASDFYDGKIYRLNASGVPQPNAWDHGANLPSAVGPTGAPLLRSAILGFDGASSYAALGRRPWGLDVYQGRLYYSIWSQDFSRCCPGPTATSQHGTLPTEIWSVALDVNGDPLPPARLELRLPNFSLAAPYTNPVSDVRFSPMGTMLLAERTMTGNNSSYAHSSRLLEAGYTGSGWSIANVGAYQIGVIAAGTTPANSAGGVDVDFGPGGKVWGSGDAIHFASPDFIYGLQGLPPGGGTVTNSILIDLNDDVSTGNKTQIGDVRLPCPSCANPVTPPTITGPQVACVSPAHYSVVAMPGVTYTWAVSGGTPASGTGPSIDVTWNAATGGTVTVTATGPAGCNPVTVTLQVVPCTINCPLCSQFTTHVVVPAPVVGASGVALVQPVVSSNMPGVTSVTVTLLNATVAYTPASCGVSGPLPAYISQALPATGTSGLNPPFLPVPNGNQAIWQASGPSVSLTGGVTTPVQVQLPPPPVFTNPACRATFSFCLRVSLATADCRDCDVIGCYGPFPYAKGIPDGGGGGAIGSAILVPFTLPGELTFAVPQGGYLEQLMNLLQDQGDRSLPRRIPMDGLGFEPGRSTVTEASLPQLGLLPKILAAYPALAVRVEVFAGEEDRSGGRRLALARAEEVKAVLVRAGAPRERIEVAAGEAKEGGKGGGGTASGGAEAVLVVLRK